MSPGIYRGPHYDTNADFNSGIRTIPREGFSPGMEYFRLTGEEVVAPMFLVLRHLHASLEPKADRIKCINK